MDGRVRFHRFRYHLAAGFITKKDDVLDLGSGTGYGSEILAQHARSVSSYEKEKSNIDYALKHHKNKKINYYEEDLEKMEIPFADIAVAFESLEHLYLPHLFVKELKKKIQKYIIVSVPLDQQLINVNGDIQEVGDATHHSAFTYAEFIQIFIDKTWKEFWTFRDGVTLIAVFYNKFNI